MDAFGPLCVGIDPHPGLLRAWGLTDDASGVRVFARTVVDAVAGHVAAIKPQAALFERHGSAGIMALEATIEAARERDLVCIVDAKRGDIGSTMLGYADAYLADGSALAGDALTVSPYLGFGSLEPAVTAALSSGRGVFALCMTSNPEGALLQGALQKDGQSVAAAIARQAGDLNAAELAAGADAGGAGGLGSVGLVIGATIGQAARKAGVDLAAVRGPLLAPGVGAQGAGPAELADVFGDAVGQVLASSSRGVLTAGPVLAELREAAKVATGEAATALGRG